jgi:hypothetical protein
MPRLTRSARSARPLTLVTAGVVLAGLAGCTPPPEPLDPLVGAWTSTMRIADEHNELELDERLEGEATIHFYFDGDAYYGDFDVGRYELRFDCSGGCSDFDFDASCNLFGDRLDCEGDGLWEDYEFTWERD